MSAGDPPRPAAEWHQLLMRASSEQREGRHESAVDLARVALEALCRDTSPEATRMVVRILDAFAA